MAATAHSPKSARELYRMAKRQGTWDPEEISVAEDRPHWEALTSGQREQLLKVCALFYEGEVSVADTLAWFMVAMPDPDRRAFLATQALEEVKHAEFFALYFDKVLGHVDTASYLVPVYRGVLLGVAHYMGVVEGLMAVSGYDYFEEMLGTRGIFPRLLEGIRLIRADEGRHLTHGMEYLREKISRNPEYAPLVQSLFLEQSLKIPARTEFVFQPNDFGLDRERMMAIDYAHLQQRSREAGLSG